MKKVLSIILSLALIVSVVGTIPMTASAASMSDADFFSKFDLTYSGMENVKAAVDRGDYAAAKAELVEYLSVRKANGEAAAFPITADDENYGQAVLPLDNILTGPYEFDVWLNRFTVTDKEYSLYEVDLTEKTAQELNNQAISVMLFERQKQAYPVLVASKEYSDYEPVLVVETAEGNVYEIMANHDTYVNSGATTTTYGTATELYVKEQSDSASSPFGSQTRRAYINFPLTEAANKTIEKATLKLYAKLADDATVEELDVHVISVGDTMWKESELTWAKIGGNIYSYQSADVPTWQQPNGADGEYQNVTTRFWFARSMAYEYLTYLEDPVVYANEHPLYPDGSVFGEKLIDLMDAFATQKNYGFNRTLETGERLNRWVDVLDALIDTPAVQNNPDKVCNIISYMWGDCNYLAGLDIASGSPWWSNWRIVANAGFYKGNEYFPEWKNYSTWRNRVDYNVNYTLDLLFVDDMSFAEAGPAYAVWCVELFGDCVRMAEINGRPMDKTFTEKLRYATRFALESLYPNGYDTNIGDSNYKDRMSVFNDLADYYGNDSIINAFVNGDDAGAEYFSSIYHDSNTMLMRNSWDPEEAIYMQFNNNPFDGHAHPDSAAVVMYAYGKPLLVDSGRYSYSSFNSIYNDLRYASAHNTIEAVGQSMATHANAAKPLEYATTNDAFDFATTSQTGYSGTTHTRNVFFAKNGYSIVTDYVTGSASREYRQNWHFMPSSNAEMNGNIATTNFYNEANITIANAGSTTALIRDGYHSADYGLVAGSKYASYGKTGSEVKFDTVLYPTRAGDEADVAVTDLAEGDNSKAALEIAINGAASYYYVANNDSADGNFGEYNTDAKMAYVADGMLAIVDGTNISGLIESKNNISSLSMTYEDDVVRIEGDNLVPDTDVENAIAIAVDGAVTEVYLNGESVDPLMQGGKLYAVRSTSVKGEISSNGREYNIVGENLVEGGLDALTNATGTSLLSNWQKVTNANYSESGESVRTTTLGGGNTVYAMRTFFPIEGGKSYLVRNSIYNNTGSATASHSNAGMSAIIATGAPVYNSFNNLTIYSHVEYGGFNSWSNENGPVYVGSKPSRTDYVTQPGLNKVEVVINAPAEAENIMISYGAWGSTELYFGDFEIYELEEIVNEDAVATTVTVDFVDGIGNAVADSITEEIGEGEIYIYEAPETITYNDEYFVLDEEDSTLSCKATLGENYLSAVYNRVGLVTVKHVTEDGTVLADEETYESGIGMAFNGDEYAKSSIIYESKVYNYAENADDVIVVSAKIYENVIELVYADSAEEFDGKLAHFTFDDETTGFATKYAKATSTGANVLSSDSMKGNSLYLNGTGANYLNITDADGNALLTGLEEVTVVFYAKIAGSGANWSLFMAPNTNTQGYQQEHYVGMLHNGNLIVERYNNSGARPATISVSDPTGEWKKYALVIEEGQTTVYVDGVKTTLASAHKLSDILGTNSIIQIGKANWGSGEYFNGYIDDLMIFNYALTEDQILALDSDASNVTINYVDEDGNKVAESSTTALLIGETLVEGKVQHEKLIVNSEGSYIVKEIEGLGAVADGKDISVNVVYYTATNYKATKGDSMKSANGNTTGFASEAGGEYPARLMTDNRWNKRAGLAGFATSIPSYATVEKAYVRLHLNAGGNNGTTGAALYDASALADTWTRGNVTDFNLPATVIATGTVSGEYIVFDVTDYVVDGAVDFAVYTTTDQEYIIYDSENTDYKPELIVATTEDKSAKFEITDGKAVYTAFDGETVTVAVAYYDNNNAVLKVESSIGIALRDGMVNATVEIDKTVTGAVRYKAFVWDGFNKFKPVMASIEGMLN